MLTPKISSGNNNVYANVIGLSHLTISLINYVFTKPWILGHRATDHITFDPTLLTKIETSPILVVNLPIRSSASISSASITSNQGYQYCFSWRFVFSIGTKCFGFGAFWCAQNL